MIMSAHQPAYMPWLGYMDKIKRSDIFIFLDTVQYEKNSFTNRNKIKTADGPVWLSVPVIKTNHFSKDMSEMLIDRNYNWRRKHLNAIFLAYKKAPNFNKLYPELEKLYGQEYGTIVDLTWNHLHFWLEYLGIHTKIIKSSSILVSGKKSELILRLCQAVNADYYISGIMGRGYLDEGEFSAAGIQVEFQEYKHPRYPQLYGEFIPNMGIVDFAMNASDYSVI